ncbi:MAG: WD40 repeat domain-containing protein, partial [Terrimicrobiaceae bacterium]
LDNPEDFVRIEIATALKRGVRVIPVLVDGASDGKQVINRETPTKFFGSDSINSVSFSPNGAWLAAACGDHLVRIWPVLWPTGQ